MSERLCTVQSLIVPADTIADVGCDHAKVALYCLEAGLAKTVIASDVSEKCLDKARRALAGYDNVLFVCCDGIKYDCDEAVIAGMGGMLISEILNNAKSRPQTVIACPHRNEDSVRRTLSDLGYGIDRDIPVTDRGKYYSVIRAVSDGGMRSLDELQITFGICCDVPNEALKVRLNRLYAAYMRAPHRHEYELEQVLRVMRLQGIEPLHT